MLAVIDRNRNSSRGLYVEDSRLRWSPWAGSNAPEIAFCCLRPIRLGFKDTMPYNIA
jgi:hypothetical protein